MGKYQIPQVIAEYLTTSKCEYSKTKHNINMQSCLDKYGITSNTFSIDSIKQSRYLHLKRGKYVLVDFPNITNSPDSIIDYFVKYLSKCLDIFLIDYKKPYNVIVFGLGNRYVSADSLGDKVIKNIIATNHVKLPTTKTMPNVSAIATGVMGTTGIETADIISSISKLTKANIVIVIDSLCANVMSRVGSNFQITDSGFVPGLGVQNKCKAISLSRDTKVISIGVPLVAFASTYMLGELEKYGITKNKVIKAKNNSLHSKQNVELFDALIEALHSTNKGELVCPSNIDELSKIVASIISRAINYSLMGIEKL